MKRLKIHLFISHNNKLRKTETPTGVSLLSNNTQLFLKYTVFDLTKIIQRYKIYL